MPESLTTAEVAERYARTVRAVEHWAAKGCPCTKGEDGFLSWSPPEVEAWLRETKRWAKIERDLAAGPARKKPGPKPRAAIREGVEGAAPPSSKAKKPSSRRRSKPGPKPRGRARAQEEVAKPSAAQALTAARRRKEEALARKHELSARKMAGETIDKRASLAAFTVLGEALNGLAMAIPGRLAGRLARLKDTSKVHAVLEEAMLDLLEDLAEEFSRGQEDLEE